MMIYKNGDNKTPIMVDTDVDTILIEQGTESVTIDKMYGPTIFATLRITPDIERGWVIERQWIETGDFVEWCVIPAQIEQEFTA